MILNHRGQNCWTRCQAEYKASELETFDSGIVFSNVIEPKEPKHTTIGWTNLHLMEGLFNIRLLIIVSNKGGIRLGPFCKHSLMDGLSISGLADPSKTTRSFVVSRSDFNTP